MNLDLKDKKILAELDMDARISHSKLAKAVQLSKQVVKYRVEKLEKENIIQGYNAIINLNKINRTLYVVYMKLVNISSKDELEWINKMQSHPSVAALGKNAGQWDLTLVINCRNNHELDVILKECVAEYGNQIKEKLITSEIESTYFNVSMMYSNQKEKKFQTSKIQIQQELDKQDTKILRILSHDCRTSLLDMAKEIGMSANGVKERIKRLEKENIVIGYKTKINYEILGYLHFRVLIKTKYFSEEIYSKFKQFLKQKGNVESISRYMGYADIDFRCYSKEIIEFYDLISKIRDNFVEEVIQVDSMPIFSWKKISYFPSDMK